ncbi:MAG: Oxidoreductase, short chain dehydrogenase/reductase family [Betaproteobacteria bacterium]|nr:Oxidoreductase, short chain dehydrogenase/reductase family [Betaproteobacteria bacterium]
MTKTLNSVKTTALITGASTGIGATYADRLARRGYNLILVARDQKRMEALAERLRADTGVTVDILQADLTRSEDLATVEARLRGDERIGLLVNNAGMAAHGSYAAPDLEAWSSLISLNVTALTRLTGAVVPRFLAQGKGEIINIASVLALAPEMPLGPYAATKSFVVTLTQGLNLELGARGIYAQAVLPAATRTEIWERSGRDVNSLTGVMEVGEMVDAALVGFDRRETITLPSLPDAAQWDAYDNARKAMLPNFPQEHAAARYQA